MYIDKWIHALKVYNIHNKYCKRSITVVPWEYNIRVDGRVWMKAYIREAKGKKTFWINDIWTELEDKELAGPEEPREIKPAEETARLWSRR